MIGKWLLGLFLKHWFKALLVGAVIGVLGVVWASGYRTAWRQAEADTLKATIAVKQRDIDASTLQRKADQNAILQLEVQAAADEAQNEALRKALAERDPAAGRGLTQSELDLLLGKRR